MASKSGVIWTLKELTTCIRERQLNKYDANIGVSGKRGDGKCEIKGSKVLMSNGLFKNIEEIEIGDEVISPQEDGTFIFARVDNTHNHYEKEVYEVREKTRGKKVLYTCSGEHQIPVLRRHSKRTSKDDSTSRIRYRKLTNMEAKKLTKSYTRDSKLCSFSTSKFQTKIIKEPSIEPYCLGVFLGDGCYTKNEFSLTSADLEIINHFNKFYKFVGIDTRKGHSAKRCRLSKNSLFGKELKNYGLFGKKSGDKFIPTEHINYSIDNKLKLLAGLIDTDGFISKYNQITICTKSYQLAEDIKSLVFSLGGYSLIRKIYKNCQTFKGKRLYYDVSVQFKNPKIIPLKLKRKSERLRICAIEPRNIAIECFKINPQRVYGFSINGKSKWYITNNYMVTHNSTLLFKIFNSFKRYGFNQEKHQEYSREKIISLLANQTFSFCWDDEAINSGYKRDFQAKGQKNMIKIITNYRDNFNVVGSAIPFFYSLDRDLRELIYLHIHIIERGVAVLLMPMGTSIHSTDPWDTIINTKIEQQENQRLKRNPNAKFRYHRFTTFAGYLYFGPMTSKQEKKYVEIKKRKRASALNIDGAEVVLDFNQKVYNRLIEGKLTKEGLQQMCLIEGKKYSSITSIINNMLIDVGEEKRMTQFFRDKKNSINYNKDKDQINELLPDV